MNFKFSKKILIFAVISIVFGCLITIILTNLNYNNYIKSNNQAILRVITAMLDEGSLDKSDIVKLLESDMIIDENILSEYGYNIDTKYFLEIKQENLNKNILTNVTVVIFIIVILFSFLIFIKYRQNKEINKIIFYLQELNDKNYSLKIEENSEDDLSILKNEIYKITVFLKEQAENSNNDKILVKNNIVNISHQLKTPITSMSIMLDNLIDYPEMDEKTRTDFILNIRESVFHIEFLVLNMLKLSKFDANVIDFKNEKILFKDLVNQSLKTLQSLIFEKEINVKISGDENAFFMGDFKWQCEAICNIIKNSIEHSYQKGNIDISYMMNNFYSKTSIKDYGAGIKKENLNKIFQRYYKGENSSENSLGIGLNLAKTIIEKNNATINLSSDENKGTIFEIRYIRKA